MRSSEQTEAFATVDTVDGTLRGAIDGGVVAFKGIPYAAPPIGENRWRAPQPVSGWSGTRDALAFGNDCVQAPSTEPLQTATAEDCLYLNVWTPVDFAGAGGLPVMVWIHGGGYVGGGSSIPYYDGTAFARQGIVVVSINYRLGRFGFFAHPALFAATEEPVGNFGYMDQIQALHWVRQNIAAFGGDPLRVTVAGESAGGASILHLMTSPIVPALFQQAIVLSGGGREAIISRPLGRGKRLQLGARQIDAAFALAHGIVGKGRRALAQLRALDPLVLAGDESLDKLAKVMLLGGPLPGVPIVDDHLVVGQPQDHFLAGTVPPIPILIGSTARDVPLIFPPSKVDPLAWFGEDEAAAHAAYEVASQRLLPPDQLVRLLLSIGADMTMHEPAHFVARAMHQAGQASWVYRFTYTAEHTRPDDLAQIHSGELPFFFDTLAARYGDATTDNDRAMATAFNTYAARFITTGSPNVDHLPAWPAATPDTFDLMHFTLDDGPVHGPDPRPGVPLVARARERHQAAQERGREAPP